MSGKTLLVRPGSVTSELRSVHGDLDQWFIRVSGLGEDAFEIVDPTRGPLPVRQGQYDRVLITGSLDAAYADLPWIGGLESFIRGVAESEIPLLGVCFGAQIIATALGGCVEANPKGCELGTIQVELLPAARSVPLFREFPERFAAQSYHDDYIVRLPEGAELLATNNHTRVQAYRLGSRIHAVQFHPEISARLMLDILRGLLEAEEIDGERGQELMSQVVATPVATSLLDRFFV